MQISQYQPVWQEKFSAEREKLEAVFGDVVLAIEHIGSTAVDGLSSKPIIDIAVMIANSEDADAFTENLAQLGYKFYPSETWNIPPSASERHFYTRGDPIEYHLSIAYADRGGFWPRQILFRDHLRSHQDSRDEYATLKEELSHNHLHKDPGQSKVNEYSGGKTDFVYRILEQTGRREGQKYGE